MIINAQHYSKIAVLGLGLTGQSCVRFLLQQGITPTLFDTRTAFNVSTITEQFGSVALNLGTFDGVDFSQFEILLVSPGIAISHPAIKAAAKSGCLIWGDIELFGHFVQVPVIAITGSNGKTTVTTLLGEMANQAGIDAAIGGNIGIPVLDLVLDQSIELFILELSSFQLETTHQLKLIAATVLNVTDDHLDRYDDFSGYVAAKHRIFELADTIVVNRDDRLSAPSQTKKIISFGANAPVGENFGLVSGSLYQGAEALLNVEKLAMVGQHNQMNALAALALGQLAGLPINAMLTTLKQFSGLAHRCQQISEHRGITWLNDSKATNVGATLAALEGLSNQQGKLIVIVGGDAKGANINGLKQPFSQYVDQLIVIGRDKELFVAIYPQAIRCDDLTQAVIQANQLAQTGDTVLLSPACASLDMFKNYIERGQCFISAVEKL